MPASNKYLREGRSNQDVTRHILDVNGKIMPRAIYKQLERHYDAFNVDQRVLESMSGFRAFFNKRRYKTWSESTYDLKIQTVALSKQVLETMEPSDTSSPAPNGHSVDLQSGVTSRMTELSLDAFSEARDGPLLSSDISKSFPPTTDNVDDMEDLESLTPETLVREFVQLILSEEQRNLLPSLTGREARNRVERIDKVLKAMPEDEDFKALQPMLLDLLRRLCGENSYWPRSFNLALVEKTGHAPVGCGGFGLVWKGTYNGRPVAIKMPKPDMITRPIGVKQSFCKEAVAWMYARHPNITPFYGVFCDKQSPIPWLISKWMPNRTITSYLLQNPLCNRFDLLVGAASGLEFLHNMGYVHADLKGDNILIDENKEACLSDFGLTGLNYEDKPNFIKSSTAVDGAIGWKAPELLEPRLIGQDRALYTHESDVYAFAMVMWEVMTGNFPFMDLPEMPYHRLVGCFVKGYRMKRPSGATFFGLTKDMWDLMESSWKHQPQDRLTIPAIREKLRTLQDAFVPRSPDLPWSWPVTIELTPVSELDKLLNAPFREPFSDRQILGAVAEVS